MYNRLFLVVISFVFFSFSVSAQEEEYDEDVVFKPSYSVKWNPAGLYFGKITFGGEVNINQKRSITAVIGIPNDRTLSHKFGEKEESVTYKTTSLMGGYRMYLGKKTMTGLYFEPYLKYLNNQALLPDVKTTINGEQATFRLNTEYTGIGVGAQLGLQFNIAERVIIDWFLLGPEINRSKFQLTFQDISNPPTSPWGAIEEGEASTRLDELLSDIPLLGNKVNISVDRSNKTVRSSYRGALPAFRTGISIGLRF